MHYISQDDILGHVIKERERGRMGGRRGREGGVGGERDATGLSTIQRSVSHYRFMKLTDVENHLETLCFVFIDSTIYFLLFRSGCNSYRRCSTGHKICRVTIGLKIAFIRMIRMGGYSWPC